MSIVPLPDPGFYRHKGGTVYRVIGTFMHTETNEPFVCYERPVGRIGWLRWCRPAGGPDGFSTPGRFEPVRDEDLQPGEWRDE